MTGNQKPKNLELATFAGGCFWCIESAFTQFPGVVSLASGYMGSGSDKPEVVQITYDPHITTYTTLLDQFWRQIDPTDPDGQFADRGPRYHTAIFYHNTDQKNEAEKSKKLLDSSGKFSKPIATKVLPVQQFYRAEDAHQQFAQKNPLRYNFYALASGRKGFIAKNWEKKV